MKKIVAAAFLVFGLAACGGGGSGTSIVPTTSLPTPTPVPTPIQAGANYVAVGDSITYGMYATNYNTESYAADAANDLHAKLTNLGIPGETSTNVIADEIAKIPPSAQVISIFIGTNDELEFAEGSQTQAVVEATFATNIARLSGILHAKYWQARIYVANLPNIANFPEWRTASAAERSNLSALNAAMNARIDAMGFPVVDLRCDPHVYDAADMFGAGLALGYVHPNTQGHEYYADDFYATMKGALHEAQDCSFARPV